MNSPKRLLKRQQIQNQFDRAAATYDNVAGLQRRMGKILLGRIANLNTPKHSRLVDLGCGTGELLQRLEREGYSDLCGLDLSSQMISVARQKSPTAKFHHAAIEELPFEESCFDVAISNAAIQWCDADVAANKMFRVVKPGGTILINVFTAGTLRQWHDAFVATGFESRVHPLAGAEEIEAAFTAAGFADMEVQLHREAAEFDSIESMYASIRQLGATNAMSSRSRGMSRGEYLALKDHFQVQLDSVGKLQLDFEWVQIEARKKLDSR